MTKDLTVFIGRFSPFHLGHAFVLHEAMKTSKAVLILVGSSGNARNTKNPFTFDERSQMINQWVSGTQLPNPAKVLIRPLYDHLYNDQAWIRGVQDAVDNVKHSYRDALGSNPSTYLTGVDKDGSTWYLHAFADLFQIDLINQVDNVKGLNATTVRETLFSCSSNAHKLSALRNRIPSSTYDFLEKFMKTPECEALCAEYEFIENYKKGWENSPYAPQFQTVDACVIQSGQILVNVRAAHPGKGLWALPGGFLEVNERLIDGAVRELKEETGIALSDAQLYGSIRHKEDFDHPERSLRGRTLTKCFLFKLQDTKSHPKTKPQKGEVKKVMWVTISEALKRTDMWFEDHLEMVRWGVERSNS